MDRNCGIDLVTAWPPTLFQGQHYIDGGSIPLTIWGRKGARPDRWDPGKRPASAAQRRAGAGKRRGHARWAGADRSAGANV